MTTLVRITPTEKHTADVYMHSLI